MPFRRRSRRRSRRRRKTRATAKKLLLPKFGIVLPEPAGIVGSHVHLLARGRPRQEDVGSLSQGFAAVLLQGLNESDHICMGKIPNLSRIIHVDRFDDGGLVHQRPFEPASHLLQSRGGRLLRGRVEAQRVLISLNLGHGFAGEPIFVKLQLCAFTSVFSSSHPQRLPLALAGGPPEVAESRE